ncbi:cell division ATP-binding protein FtsE [bacterium (Candidatus Torokbacteria) CG_4_10_14_0_2_um_filter_35_8]|nr:MAG: cell division ATP-binding protein FtsE [bacterium (Candidatus Torokbacteria) CG_4_10_14_0_2_um_filter_35_8]
MINFKNISKIYPKNTVALSDINLVIKKGEFVSIVGKSGAGKTTIARLITAEEKPTQGYLEVLGFDMTKIPGSRIPELRRQIGVVFQDFKLLPESTVSENVAFAMEVCNIPSNLIEKDVDRLLRLVELSSKKDKFPDQLSGGEKQRVSLARALANKPSILIADEPTGNLDMVMAKEIVDLLSKVNELGTTVILATHNKDIVNRVEKRVVTLEDGKIISDISKGRYKL